MKSYHKFYKIKANPEEVYNALVKPFAIELWTGEKAEMEESPGSIFSIFGGDITGVNIEFIPNEKIVQEWFFGETEKESIVTIKLKSAGRFTSIELLHVNIPDDAFEDIRFGWDNYYFGGLQEFFHRS
jgi:activator of HSP90 ATPase